MKSRAGIIFLLATLICLHVSACSSGESLDPTLTPSPTISSPAATPTPTPLPPMDKPATPTPPDSPCAGLSGEIEVSILVGPSDAVGLEPRAVGNVPFAVTTAEPPYLLQGSGPINYADILTEQWGTYEVTMDMQLIIQGECSSTEDSTVLQMSLEMSGSQMVEVTAEGFHGEYPWSGTHNFDLVFPLEEGATIEGEGYSFVLHLNK